MIRYGMEAKIRSAFSVVIPPATASSEYSALRPDLHQRVGPRDVRGRPLHHRDVGADLPQRSADVEGGVVGPDDHAPLALVRVRAGMGRGVMLVPAEHLHTREGRDVGPPGHPGGQHELLRVQHHGLAVPLDVDRPLSGGLVVGRALGLGVPPVVELHDLRVGLEPVGDLVLGREHRPVLGELQVRHVVVPDGIVQAQALVPAAPLIAGTGALVDDDRRHTELPQPGRQPDAGLAAADDQHIGLLGEAQFLRLVLALLQPGGPAPAGAVLGALGAAGAFRFLVPPELIQRGEQGPGLAVAEAQMPVPRPTAVSKSIHASVMPPASAGSSPPVTRQPLGWTLASVSSSISVISWRPSKVLMFQVNAMRSRQKQSSVNRAAASVVSFDVSASLNAVSQVCTAVAAWVGGTVVVIQQALRQLLCCSV